MSDITKRRTLTARLCLWVCYVLLGLSPAYAAAEDAATDGAAIEEVVVTGTRIKSNANSSQPVTSVGEEVISQGGQFDLSEILNDAPPLLNSVSSTNSLDGVASNLDQASTQNFGGSSLDLRGLGDKRTLTLVNGRRHVSGIEGTAAVDISTIPTALIERIDVLSGGASAVYGSDAVTGVVNIILKDNFEGLEFSLQGGTADQGDNSAGKFSVVGGRNFASGRGNVTFALQYENDTGLDLGDRDFLAQNGLFDDDANPALRFQIGDLAPSNTPNFSAYYDFDTTGLFPWGLRIPSADTFIADYTAEFGVAPTLTQAELDLLDRGANAFPRAILQGRTFNITSPYGVVAIGDFGVEFPLGSEPDLDGDGTTDCLQSFNGYNSSLDGAGSFGIAGGCWAIDADGNLVPYEDGLVAGSFNQFGADQSYIRPNRTSAIPERKQWSIDVNGHFDITEQMSVFWESKYIYQEIEAVEQYHNFTDLLYGAPDNPFLPDELSAFINNSGLGFAGIDGGLHISRDADDWGSNVTTNERETMRFVLGLEGAFNDVFSYEISGNYGKFQRDMVDREEMIADRFFAAIDAVADPVTGEAVCRSDLDSTAYPHTTPFNIFQFVGGGVDSSFFTFTPGDGQCQPMDIWGGRRAMSQESIDFVTYDREVSETIEQTVFSGFISGDSSPWFELPAGPIGLVVGLEYREEKTSQDFGRFDQGILPVSGITSEGLAFSAGDWVGSVSEAASLGPAPATRLLPSSSEYDFFDYFLEVSVPLLSDMPGAQELYADLAYRNSDNSVFGSNDTYKYGLVWTPVNDVTFRYTFSEATRVPNLFELFSPEQGARFRPDDPCASANVGAAADPGLREANCILDLQANGVDAANIFDSQGNYAFEDPLSAGFPGAIGGNEDLVPETGETTSYGFVFTPGFLDGLVLSVDYIEIEIEDAILEVSAQNIVNRCYDSPSLNNSFCPLISRNDDSASAQSGGLDFLRQVQLNFGSANYEGYDITLQYDFAAFETNFSAGVTWTHVKTLELIETGGAGEPDSVDDELGEMRRPSDAALATLSAVRGPFAFSWTTQYLDKQLLTYEDGAEIETALANYGPSAFTDSSTFIHDFRGSYSQENYTVFGGVNNVTDEEPFVSERAYPVSPIGRYFYMGVTVAL
ncbi:MAG: TonB-dependent receptor [Pseudomonadaceae bacterium]|nr:TonB-dependent receptor [Pseudomonadaceae bacterium]